MRTNLIKGEAMKTVNIGDLTFQVLSPLCDHCGKEPTEEDVVRAVQKAHTARCSGQFRCAFCGEGIVASSYEMYHGRDGWNALEKDVEPAISMEILPQKGPRICGFNGLHERCIPKALPYVNGLGKDSHESDKR